MNWNWSELEEKGDTQGYGYLYDMFLYRLGNHENNHFKRSIAPKPDQQLTTVSFYDFAGRAVELPEKLIPHDLSVINGLEAYLAYLAPGNRLGKYASLVLGLPENTEQLITQDAAIAYFVNLYGLDEINIKLSNSELIEDQCLFNSPYEYEWQVAKQIGFIGSIQDCPNDSPLKGDEAVKLIADWIDKFSVLFNSKNITITLLTEKEKKELLGYGLTEIDIKIMGYPAVKNLLRYFATDLLDGEERNTVIKAFLEGKCATISNRNAAYCPDGKVAALPPD